MNALQMQIFTFLMLKVTRRYSALQTTYILQLYQFILNIRFLNLGHSFFPVYFIFNLLFSNIYLVNYHFEDDMTN